MAIISSSRRFCIVAILRSFPAGDPLLESSSPSVGMLMLGSLGAGVKRQIAAMEWQMDLLAQLE
jgi:hypothetical protein